MTPAATQPTADDLARVLSGDAPLDSLRSRGPLWLRMLALLLALFGKQVEEPAKERQFTRTAYKRKGWTTHIADLQTGDTFMVRADNAPEARMLVQALTAGALACPSMPARDVATAASKAVNVALERQKAGAA